MSCLGVSSCFICGLASICISLIGFENRRSPMALKREALAAVEDPQPGTQRSELRQVGWDQEVAAFLRNSPQWWLEWVALLCRRGRVEERQLNLLASDIACAIYGSPHRWRELVPAGRDTVLGPQWCRKRRSQVLLGDLYSLKAIRDGHRSR